MEKQIYRRVRSAVLVSLLVVFLPMFPTSCVTEEVTPEEDIYLSQMSDFHLRLIKDTRDVSTLMNEMDLNNDTWRVEIAMEIFSVQRSCLQIRDISIPPGRVAREHKKYMQEGIDYLFASMDLLAQGLSEASNVTLSRSADYLEIYNDAAIDYTDYINSEFNR